MSWFGFTAGQPALELAGLAQHSLALLVLGASVEVLHRLTGPRLSPRLRAWLWTAVVLRSLIPPGVRGLRTVSAQVVGQAQSLESAGLPVLLLLVWAVGVAITLVRVLRFRAPIGRAPSPEEHAAIRRCFDRLGCAERSPRVEIGQDDRLRAPAVLGPLLAPKIWLPEGWLGEGRRSDLLHALAHELSHLERRDLIWARFTQLWCAFFWFHPIAHLAAYRLAELREIHCDRQAARRLGESPASYGSWLAGLALAQRPVPSTGLALGGRTHALVARIESVVHSRAVTAPRASLQWAELGAFALLLGLVLPPRTISDDFTATPSPADPGCLELRYRVLAEFAKVQETVSSDIPSTAAPNDEAHSTSRSR